MKSTIKIFLRFRYILLLITTSFLFFSLSILPKNFDAIFSLSKRLSFAEYMKFIIALYKGSLTDAYLHSTVILIIISVLIGIVVSLITFKVIANSRLMGNISKSGAAGTFVGMLVPVCAPCGIGLLSLIGIGGVIAYLPYQGTELGILAILLLLYSIYSLSKSINGCASCRIELK
ncbi:MAG: hypothetical protein Q8Q42_00785 [Nanoarchaeota archaeon]|nr:hypothetical protein [Nanoarchaeota archaeon]